MLATLPHDLRGLRDRAILLIGFAGGLRRSEIVSLDHAKDDTPDSGGWIEIMEDGTLITLRGKTGWREAEICPVAMLETWLKLGRITRGPVFRPIARKNGGVAPERLSDKHVARLVQKTALAAGLRGDLPEGERRRAFSGHSLRAGLASSARDRFRVNLTKAAGL